MSRMKRLESKLRAAFESQLFEIHDESHMHAGPHLETHFKLTLVSPDFLGMSRVKRHQAVYAQIQDELDSGLHAIALHLFCPDQWAIMENTPDSPNCQGGH